MSLPITALPDKTTTFDRLRQRYVWTAAVVAIFTLMVIVRAIQLPVFGGFEIRTITAGALAVGLLAMAQGVVLISGGINMSVGALMVLINCLSAKYMQNSSFVVCMLIAVGCIVLATLLSVLMGWIINVSGIPDIVVTLAMSFTFTGLAWLIIRGPGGGTNQTFRGLLVGGLGNPIPSIVLMILMVAAVWVPFSRSRTGLAMYAMGSSKQAAYLAGVNVAATRIKVYLLSGAIVGLAGLVTTAYTGGGEPRGAIGMAALMGSVAAAVLGGIALTGGSGGMFGPIIASMILGLIPGLLLGRTDPNYAQVVQGVVIILVVLAGGALQMRRQRA